MQVTVASVFGLSGISQLCKLNCLSVSDPVLTLLMTSADYSASKHALIGLHESLRLELKYK